MKRNKTRHGKSPVVWAGLWKPSHGRGFDEYDWADYAEMYKEETGKDDPVYLKYLDKMREKEALSSKYPIITVSKEYIALIRVVYPGYGY